MTVQEVLMQYQTRLQALQTGALQARLHYGVSGVVMGVAVALLLFLSVCAIRQQAAFWSPSLPIPLVAVSARRYRKQRQARFRMSRLERFYEQAVERIQGEWTGRGPAGDEFRDSDHIYAEDLHIFGDGSLFQLLCITRTAIGQRGLANYLLQAPAREETRSRQEAVRELSPRTDLRETVTLLGDSDVSESSPGTFEDWLRSPTFSFPPFLRAFAAVSTATLALIVVGGAVGLIPWIDVAISISPLVAIHAAVGLAFRSRVNTIENWVRPVSAETQVLRAGLQFLENQNFRSAKLCHLASEVSGSTEAVRKLERLLNVLNERHKDWFYSPSLFLMLGTQLCMAIEEWRRKHGERLRKWLRAWAEFEALNSLACYAFENPDNGFPAFYEGPARFEAADLSHPLLPHESSIGNDIAFNNETRFCMISGSNMSGKSTLLRAIGLNAVLALAGGPVRARALCLSRLSVCASISVVDSLRNAKSRFLAEVDRLRQTLETAAHDGPVLFLVDEIFSGTNSRDRRLAAEAVVRALVERHAIGALSTHDLALTEIPDDSELHGVNMHMGARAEGGPLDFDYQLKPGVTTESNALTIARMAGVPV